MTRTTPPDLLSHPVARENLSLLQAFAQSLATRPAHTRSAYVRDASVLAASAANCALRELTARELRRFLATLHGRDVLATTVLQTCIRYQSRSKTCQFCAIGQSLAAGRTIERKTPAQLAEVAKAAVTLDGVKHMVMTTGTPRAATSATILCERGGREGSRRGSFLYRRNANRPTTTPGLCACRAGSTASGCT
jgi:hypothetical protein